MKFSDHRWYELGCRDGAIGFTDKQGYENIIVDRYWPDTSGNGQVEDDEERAGNVRLVVNAPNMYKALLKINSILQYGDNYAVQCELNEILEQVENYEVDEG